MDSECRKEWSKRCGQDTYGSADDSEGDSETKLKGQKKCRQGQVPTSGRCRACGSPFHLRSNHSRCPFNKKKMEPNASRDGDVSENSDIICLSDDAQSDPESFTSEWRVSSPDSCCFEDNIIAGESQADGHGKSKLPKVDTAPTKLGKRERSSSDKPPPVRKRKPDIKVGDYVGLHKSRLDKCHIPCHMVQMFGKRCSLYCHKGVLRTGYAKSQLVALGSDLSIPVEDWRTAAKVSLGEVVSDPSSLEVCCCDLDLDKPKEVIVLSSDEESTVENIWYYAL